MNMPCLPRWCLGLFALAASVPAHAQMIPANDRVRVEVRVSTDSDHKDLANTTADRVTQGKTLAISLSGKARDRETRVVRWTAYGRNLKNNSLHPLATGEFKLALDAQGKQVATSKEVKTTYTPEHAVVVRDNNRGRLNNNRNQRNNVPRTKNVAAEGSKYVGYSVQVLDGGKVVGETSDPVGIATSN
jgi:hypothetical protein